MKIAELFIVIAVVVVVLVVFILVFRGENVTDFMKRKAKNQKSEKSIKKPLQAARRFAAMQQYQVISPARLAKNGVFADIDFIIVGVFGLLCVKCIGLGGEIYGSAGDANWLQVIGENRTSFDNPLQRSTADTRLVRDSLFAAKLKSVPVETVCVFTNKTATLAVPRGAGHLTVKEFKALLGKDRFLTDKKVDIEKAAAAVKEYLV